MAAATFWEALVRFERAKMTPWLALRNSLGVALPLAAGVALGQTAGGIVMASGALNVAFSDSHEPYRLRLRRMLAASVLVGVAVTIGSLTGDRLMLAVAVAGAWAFAAGILVALSNAAADLGVMSLVTLVVFAALPQTPEHALLSGCVAFAGGALQTALAVAWWPVRGHTPERRALAELFHALARAAPERALATLAPPASAESTAAQTAVAPLRDRSTDSERYRLLLSQAERIRLTLLALARLRTRIARDHPGDTPLPVFTRAGEVTAELLDALGSAMEGDAPASDNAAALEALAAELHEPPDAPPPLAAMLADARFHMHALAGQLRNALDLAASTTSAGAEAQLERETRRPWYLRLEGTFAILRANFDLDSAAFRHAVRLAACIALGDALGRGLELRRSYWLPMTIAIVLKPDFTATFSRGVLRLAGTFAGLVLATVLFHLLPVSGPMEVALVGLLMFLLRWVGPANYGVLVVALTAMVVFLIGLTGVAPQEVVAARGLNTLAGGAIALAAYAVWPTWERRQAPEVMARMLDAYRDYFRAVRLGYLDPQASADAERDRVRLAARLARSNVEASVERLVAEPATSPATIKLLTGMLASSHRMVHAIMALEAGLAASDPVPARAPFAPFANAVERTLHSLAAALRGSRLTAAELPDLRAAHLDLASAGDPRTARYALVNVETDRITNSLNTLAEEVLALAGR